MADTSTSKFWKKFETNTGNPLVGATIELIPQENTYPNGKITLIEHPTRKGYYYKSAVPMGEYKIYINGSLYEQNIFHAENILKYIRTKFDNNLEIPGSTIKDRDVQLEDLSSEVRALLSGENFWEIYYINIFNSGDLNLSGYEKARLLILFTSSPYITISSIIGYSPSESHGRPITLKMKDTSAHAITLSSGSNMSFSTPGDRVLQPGQAITLLFNNSSQKWEEVGNTLSPESDFEALFNSLIVSALIAKEQITGLSPNKAVISNSTGQLVSAENVTSAEVARLAGVNDNIQDQLDNLDTKLVNLIPVGFASFSGTLTEKYVETGLPSNWSYFVQPLAINWNANDHLIVERKTSGFTVRRNVGGTSDLQFSWIAISPKLQSVPA